MSAKCGEPKHCLLHSTVAISSDLSQLTSTVNTSKVVYGDMVCLTDLTLANSKTKTILGSFVSKLRPQQAQSVLWGSLWPVADIRPTISDP